jgi:hypothetical protein
VLRSRLSSLLALVALASGPAAVAHPQRQLHVVEEDWKPPPDTLPGLAMISDLVAMIRVDQGESGQGQATSVETRFRVTCLQVARDTSDRCGTGPVTILRPTGRLGDIEAISPKVPTLEQGGVYLVFLRWSEKQRAYVLASGPTSLYSVNDALAVVPLPSASVLAQRQRGRQISAIISELRAAVP